VTVAAVDMYGNAWRSGDPNFVMTCYKCSSSSVSATGDGATRFSLTATSIGMLPATFFTAGFGAPVTYVEFNITPAPFDMWNSTITGPTEWTAGESVAFDFVPRDAYGNISPFANHSTRTQIDFDAVFRLLNGSGWWVGEETSLGVNLRADESGYDLIVPATVPAGVCVVAASLGFLGAAQGVSNGWIGTNSGFVDVLPGDSERTTRFGHLLEVHQAATVVPASFDAANSLVLVCTSQAFQTCACATFAHLVARSTVCCLHQGIVSSAHAANTRVADATPLVADASLLLALLIPLWQMLPLVADALLACILACQLLCITTISLIFCCVSTVAWIPHCMMGVHGCTDRLCRQFEPVRCVIPATRFVCPRNPSTQQVTMQVLAGTCHESVRHISSMACMLVATDQVLVDCDFLAGRY
jgi:hypothetical protein